jgi:hypothetical protein
MINVTKSTDINVGLGSFKFSACHFFLIILNFGNGYSNL